MACTRSIAQSIPRCGDGSTSASAAGVSDRVSFHDDPVRVRGRLTRDAALTPSGASMQVAVSQVSMGGAWESVEGGLSVSVGGALASDVAREWRAGRLVEFPVALRTAARYLNAGVPDGERALARRGTALVGSVKSGALVEVLARGPMVGRARGRRSGGGALGDGAPRRAS